MTKLTIFLPVLLAVVLTSCSKNNQEIKNSNFKVSSDESISSPLSLNKGLVAAYPFAGNLTDFTGHGHNGHSGTPVTYIPNHENKPHRALALGTTGIVTDNFFDFQYTDSFSVGMWLMVSSNGSGGRILSTECPEGNFRVASYGNGVYAWQLGSSDNYIYDTISLNTWYHMVYTFNKRKVQLYKNGKLKYSGQNNSTDPLNYCSPFTIGAKAPGGSDFWQGGISNLVIYNRAISQTEVRQLYNF